MSSPIKVRTGKQADSAKIPESWGHLNWLANASLLGATGVTLGRVLICKGQSNPRHRHNRCEEVLYLLTGRLRHTVGDDSVILEAGDSLLIPAGIFHNAFSIGDVDADMIVAYSTAHRDFEPEAPPAK